MTGPRVIEVSPAERAVVVELAADGATNQQIGERLGVTHWTVSTHLKRVMKRAGHSTRTGLAVDLVRGRLKLRLVTYGRGPDDEAGRA